LDSPIEIRATRFAAAPERRFYTTLNSPIEIRAPRFAATPERRFLNNLGFAD
jgi:hypothetical protein